MYLSAAIYHIKKQTAMGRRFLTHPRDLLFFILNGNVIESDFGRKLFKFLHTKKEIKEWEEFNTRVQDLYTSRDHGNY